MAKAPSTPIIPDSVMAALEAAEKALRVLFSEHEALSLIAIAKRDVSPPAE
jgi:hypothetical protein